MFGYTKNTDEEDLNADEEDLKEILKDTNEEDINVIFEMIEGSPNTTESSLSNDDTETEKNNSATLCVRLNDNEVRLKKR